MKDTETRKEFRKTCHSRSEYCLDYEKDCSQRSKGLRNTSSKRKKEDFYD